MMLRSSMRTILSPVARFNDLWPSFLEWALAAFVACLLLGLHFGVTTGLCVMAGLANAVIVTAVLLLLRIGAIRWYALRPNSRNASQH